MILRASTPGPMEASVEMTAGNMAIEPIFYRKDGKPIVLYLATEGIDGEAIKQYALQISGKTGELTLTKRKPVASMLDEDLQAVAELEDELAETEEEAEYDAS